MKMPKHNRTKHISSRTIKIIISVILGIMTMVVGLLLFSFMIYNGQITENYAQYGIMIIWFIASSITSIFSFTASDSAKLISVLIAAGCLTVLSVIINLLFMDGNLGGAGQCLIAMVLGCALPVIILMRKKQKFSDHSKYRFH